jgi:Cu(I)/Ag(I) efflux system membrane fusion protein
MRRCAVSCLALFVAGAVAVSAQSARDRRRSGHDRPTGVTESQATEVTLTVSEVAVRPIQVWIRTAGVIDAARRTLTATMPAAEAVRIKRGQRVRAFPPESKSSMYQARIAEVAPRGEHARVRATLAGEGREGSSRYILEVVTEDGEYLSVPNEAIIETGERRVVYVQERPGTYARREIETGVQGELYTQVREGVKPGEQVVTFGSFFIDAEHRLKGSS